MSADQGANLPSFFGNHAGLPRELHEKIWDEVKFATMTSSERVAALCDAVSLVVDTGITGDIVECGVWKGGSIMAAAHTLMIAGDQSRDLWLFDTFDGMSEPGDCDVDHNGYSARQLMIDTNRSDEQSVWCVADIEEVKRNIESTDYPAERVRYVAGPVEQTLQHTQNKPDRIAILRLDTDWYQSTLIELHELFPRLVPGGVLIVDDYGHWRGCKRAVDEYFEDSDVKICLQRIDYTGRIGVKSLTGVEGDACHVE